MPVCPYCSSEDAKPQLPTSKALFHFCSVCGVVFKELDDESHGELTETVYSTQSWGEDRAKSIAAHGPRLKGTLDWYQSQSPLKGSDHYLDIGAGVGVLVHYLCEGFGIKQSNISALEPVSEIAQLLQAQYPAAGVFNQNLEQVDRDAFSRDIDGVFCFGVDYLFRDLNIAFQTIKSLAKDGGRVMISRNIFLNMPCFYGGVRIQTAEQLFEPNPLISVFMFPDQYKELLERWFKITASIVADEKYSETMKYDPVMGQNIVVEGLVAGKILMMDCIADHSYKRDAQPIRNPDRTRKWLHKLGVDI